MTRLNPLMKISQHFEETLRTHEPDIGKKEARKRVDRGAARHGHPADALRAVPARVLRRHAAADHDRAGARAAAGGGRRRRADDGARRARRGADPAHPGRPAAQLRHVVAADHAQPRDRRRGLRPRRGHVRGPDRRAGLGLRRHDQAVASVFARAAALDDLALHRQAALDPGRAAGPREPAAGVPVPSPVPGRDEDLRADVAADRRHRPRAPVGVLAALRRRTSRPGWRRRSSARCSPWRRKRDGGRDTEPDRGPRPRGPLRAARDVPLAADRSRRRLGEGRRRRVVRPPRGRGARAGRRVRLRQDDAGPRRCSASCGRPRGA